MSIKNSISIVQISDCIAKASEREIGERIRTARIEIGLNQQQLGGLIGVTGQQIQKYETAKNSLSVSRLMQIAKVLDVPLSLLIPDIEGASEPLRRVHLQLLRNTKALETADPELFAALCKMFAVCAKSLQKRVYEAH